VIFNTIGKLAGIGVISTRTSRRGGSRWISTSDAGAGTGDCIHPEQGIREAGYGNMIFVIQDTAQKHRDYDETVVKTFYLSILRNRRFDGYRERIAAGCRDQKRSATQLADAIIVRDTPDKNCNCEETD